MTSSILTRYNRKQYDLLTEEEIAEARAAAVIRVKKYMTANPLKAMYTGSKAKAKRRGIQFDLSYEEFQELAASTTHCPIFNCQLSYLLLTNSGVGNYNPCKASLDRKDNSLGYTKDNCWFISWKANKMKNEYTTAQLEQLVLGLKQAGVA